MTILGKYENTPYPQFDFSIYSKDEQKIIMNLMKNYLHNINFFGLENASILFEKEIFSISNNDQQQSMLCMASQLKFSLYYSSEMIENYGSEIMAKLTWEERFDNCMYNKLSDIFDDGNWLDIAAFYTGLPASFSWMIASCAWSASTNASICYK